MGACSVGNFTNITTAGLTAPSDGYAFVYNAGSNSGYVTIGASASVAIGAVNGRTMCFVRKGTYMKLSGTVSAARFVPLS